MENIVFQCSKELLDKLPQGAYEAKPEKEQLEGLKGSFYGWTGKILTIDRKKAAVFVNNKTRYCILLYPVRKKEFGQLAEYLKEAVRAAFLAEGVRKDVIEAYLEGFDGCRFMKTSDRSAMGSLNLMCGYLDRWFCYDEAPEPGVIQTRAAMKMSDDLTSIDGKYGSGNERLPGALCEMMGYDPSEEARVLGTDVYQLKIKINLAGHNIWRRILVPADYRFCDLHRVIQVVFDWQNCHLHNFMVMEPSKLAAAGVSDDRLCSLKRKLELADGSDPEALEFAELADCEVRLDTEVSLREVFAGNDWCLYNYDFGDYWEHVITVEKLLPDSAERWPKLLKAEGQRPPEDVGGEGGFDEYLAIAGDPGHPEHARMVEWARMTGPREMSVDQVNRRLRRRW